MGRKMCPRCKKIKSFTDEYYICSDCRDNSDDDLSGDDNGWKDYY